MGQAKKRGTFEERKAQAIERNKLLDEACDKSVTLGRIRSTFGTQALATRLAMCGLLATALTPPKTK